MTKHKCYYCDCEYKSLRNHKRTEKHFANKKEIEHDFFGRTKNENDKYECNICARRTRHVDLYNKRLISLNHYLSFYKNYQAQEKRMNEEITELAKKT